MNASRTYNIKDDPVYFRAGIARDGKQVLFVPQPMPQSPELVALFFDQLGSFIECAVREVPTGGKQTIDALVEGTSMALSTWMAELDFRPSKISIRKFSVPERSVRIEDLPDHYEYVLKESGSYADSRKRELMDDIRRWENEGDFVLCADEDYYLNRQGEIVST
jgi:hypothetical protein